MATKFLLEISQVICRLCSKCHVMVATWLPICLSSAILTDFLGVLFTQPLGDSIFRRMSRLHNEWYIQFFLSFPRVWTGEALLVTIGYLYLEDLQRKRL